ncbi:DUF1294 domain-containing protein [Clostridium paridis]|uniref:DUF1294 domain-containing protein n=1 Tax=Clostridium paridis TaxID=2803863 RepID=A0A937K3L3_9CLOT|nr:DUF1294 domain-containing protein [Clostridium paridis]MBL4932516.1 DUF1294 domain-containing protein [Clostridium paridis]
MKGINNLRELVIGYLIAINILGFFIVFKDKSAARKHKWRTKEKTLFLLALLGGSIGVFLGMQVFRHKTKHLKFVIGVPIIILFQLTLYLIFLLS